MMKLMIPFVCVTIVFAGCVSMEAVLAANVDMESNTYELAVGYNKEDAFNVLVFGDAGFLLRYTDTTVSTSGIEYEHYFTDTIGVSGRAGIRLYGNADTAGLLLQLGVPFSWAYGKITPYIGGIFDGKPRFNAGVSFALRNQAVGITFIALGALISAAAENESENESEVERLQRAERERENREGADEAIEFTARLPVEDTLPYPAWKYRERADE